MCKIRSDLGWGGFFAFADVDSLRHEPPHLLAIAQEFKSSLLQANPPPQRDVVSPLRRLPEYQLLGSRPFCWRNFSHSVMQRSASSSASA